MHRITPLLLVVLTAGCGGVSADLDSLVGDTFIVLEVDDGVAGKTGDVDLQMIWGHDASGCIAPLDSFAAEIGGAPLNRGAYDPCLKVTMTTALWSTPEDATLLDLVLDDETGQTTMTIEHLAPPVTLQADRTSLTAGDVVELTLAGPPAEQFRFGVVTALRVDNGAPLELEIPVTAPAETIDVPLPEGTPPGSYRFRADTSWSALFWNCPFWGCDGTRNATAEVTVEVTGD